jgi:DNA invertase Pin-like site-specific DNA recombinase
MPELQGLIQPAALIHAPIPAAQYLRMSTDHQKYSTQNQADAIADYASRRGFAIVRTFEDEGRSGLRFGNRAALKELISYVRSGQADFEAVLVYDVSRWGRFQDVDESAYYEFICKEAGIKVLYSAEQFEDDGSVGSTILKGIKRAMAAEFSRELSSKVFMGQCRIVKMGFWCAGRPAFGLRRLLVDENGVPKVMLERHQRKFLQSDRVVLRPGPASEVNTVKRIFRSFVIEKKGAALIAAELNEDRVLTMEGKLWTATKIGKLLANETYCGNIVFNRSSNKLKQKLVFNPPDMWIRREGAFDAIISPKVFAKAQAIVAKRRQRISDEEAISQLVTRWREKGHLCRANIEAEKGMLRTTTYRRRFGSMTAAYKRIGFRPNPRYCFTELRAQIRQTIETQRRQLGVAIAGLGMGMQFVDEPRQLAIAGGVTVSFAVARMIADGPPAGKMRWQLRWARRPNSSSDLTLVIRMDESNTNASYYYLLPTRTIEAAETTEQRVRVTSKIFTSEHRHDDLTSVARAICSFRTSIA